MPAQLLAYRCPFCERTVEVEPALAEQTVTCSNPDCHKPFHLDVPNVRPTPLLILPHNLEEERPLLERASEPAHLAAPKEAPAATPAAPPERSAATGGFTVKPVMFRRYPFRCSGYVVLVLAGLVCVALWLIHDWLALGILGLAACGFGAFRLVAWSLRNRTTSLTGTAGQLLLMAGSFTSHSTEIPYKEIVDVQVHQGLLNRLMQVGDVTLFTKMPDKQQILVMAIPDPEGVAAEIRKLRQA